jgi:UDP-N-acetylglucosamine 2-epimerase (non-hydrolysing)
MKVLSVVGARPQFVKAFPVSQSLASDHEEVLVHTGQHYDATLSDVFFEELPIPTPDENLGVGSGSHAHQTAAMLEGLDDALSRHRPDVLLVYGDTNSTLAGALVGAKRDVRVAHVEAGLRCDDRSMPEEINRLLTDRCADQLFVPSERAARRLADEGRTRGVVNTGDVTYDALLAVRERAFEHSTVLTDLGYAPEAYVLATVHRAANTDDPERLRSIIAGLGESSLPVVLPAHPRTVEALDRAGIAGSLPECIDVVDPVGYLDFCRLLAGAERVVTDSGGVQTEAFYLETPCLTLRDRTEWIETVTAGWNVLVGADAAAISRNLDRRFDEATVPQPYGDGTAAQRIVDALEEHDERPASDATVGGAAP